MAPTATTTGWEPWMAMRIALTRSGMTQKELAIKLGWDPSKVSRSLNGERDLTAVELKEVAAVLGGNYDWYIEGPSSNRAMGV